ncbi:MULTISPECIES: hypothetical protein [Anaerostipes]|uniref:Uncharacterized protein n=1 Tax=Anaerostipes rhamnosivorans TaxID=1229621 RepID=A0A4P8IG79_9FIRM|nr:MULTISPECIES: hypothetical protein [Anaerostipes]QCP34933.1 hypothetical protein AR1Y2_1479 [Anaerostipes rhamnosivorans]CDC34711.1 putative uncharacterized protein [Anaerostipes sp. CAG:276]
MTQKEIMERSNEEITIDELQEMEEYCVDLCRTDCLGSSGSHRGCTWYSLSFLNGEQVDVFVRGKYE